MREVKLSNIQLGLLVLVFLYGSSAIFNPVMLAKRDAWFALILGWIGGFILMTLYLFISKINKWRTLSEILQDCFGKVLGKSICVLYILFFLYKSTINTRAFGEFMATVSYPETPLIILVSCFILTAVYVIRSNIETMGRISEILVPLIPIPVLILSTSMITMANYTGFQPALLEIAPIIKGALSTISSVFGDFVVFLMILPYTNNKKGRFKAAYFGIIGVGILLMVITVRNLKVIGPVLYEYFTYPTHVAAQLIPGVSIDPLVDINLLLGGGFKVAICLYAVIKLTSEIFCLEDYKPLVSAFGIFVVVLSIWLVHNSAELKEWNESTAVFAITFPFQIIIPTLILFFSLILRKKNSTKFN